MVESMPVFVKIEEYKDLLDIMGLIKEKVKHAKTTLGNINELKNHEDSQLESWKQNIEDVQRKLDMIDNTLFEPQAF